MSKKVAFKTKYLEPVVGAAALGAMGYAPKKDVEGKKRSTGERVLGGVASAGLGGLMGHQFGRLSADLRTMRILSKAKNPGGSVKSVGGPLGTRYIPKYKDLVKEYKSLARRDGAGTGRPFAYENKAEILKDFKADTKATFFNTKAAPEAQKAHDSFFGIRRTKLDYDEPQKIYDKYKGDIGGTFEASRRGEQYHTKARGAAGALRDKVFEVSGLTFKKGKIFASDGTQIKTKKEVKKIINKKYMKHHPDQKGSEATFKKLIDERDAIKGSEAWDKLAELALTPGSGALAGLTIGTAYDITRNGMRGKALQGHPITIGLITGFATGLGKQIYDKYSKSHQQKTAYIKMKIREGVEPKKVPKIEFKKKKDL